MTAAMMADKVESTVAPLPSQSVRAVLLSSLVLGVVLALAGAYVVVADRDTRLAAAEQQSLALTVGGERLVWLHLRNLERALLGIGSDAQRFEREAPARADALLAESIRGVSGRHRELQDIAVIAPAADAPTPVRDDREAQSQLMAVSGRMTLGPLQRAGARWAVPLAVAMPDGRRIVARLRSEELQALVASLETGRRGRAQLVHADGTVVADSRGREYTGRRLARGGVPLQDRVDRDHVGELDGIARVQAQATVPGYPLQIRVGIARAAVLAPWWRLALAGLLLYVLCGCGAAYLVRVLRRNSRARAQLTDELGRAARDLRLAQELGRTGTWAVEPGERITWSEQVSEILGFEPERNSATIEEFYELVHPDDRERLAALFGQAWRSCESFAIDFRMRTADDRLRWLSSRGACFADDSRLRMTGTMVDVTERMESQARLADAERHFRYLFDHNPLPFWVFDVQTLRFLEVNQAALKQYGYSREEFLAMSILDIRPPEQQAAVLHAVNEATQRELKDAKVWLHRRKDGVVLEVRVYAADIEFRGRPARLVLAEDATERMAHQRELAYRASHDAITGLLDARAFAEEVEVSLGAGCTLAYVQVRGIEAIEDSLGRKAGEEMLRTLARRLGRLGEKYGAVGHVRTDEFALAVSSEPERWDEALAQLQHELSRPLRGHELQQRLEFWIGVARFPEDGADALQAIGNAGLAAHMARAEHLPLVRFKAEMAQRASDRLRLAGRVHQALENDEFALHFQIIRHVSDGQPAALEALIRWPQPQGGFIPPVEFIGICEDSGLIVPLGRWVLREAARAQRRISDAGFPLLPIAVNVSLVQFLHSDLTADVDEVIARFGLRAGALHLELTESVLMTRPEQALATLRGLQERGVCISLDDFGTGFSSLAYLRHLPLDALKIDRSFVHDVDCDPRNASICLALLALGRNLGLTVVAEGVENEAQFRWLRRHHCDQVQGYGLDRPVPLEVAMDRLKELQKTPMALPWPMPARARGG